VDQGGREIRGARARCSVVEADPSILPSRIAYPDDTLDKRI
jgi:hypothetical protein